MTKITDKDLLTWSRMGPRAMFGQFMLKLAETRKDLVVMSADLGRSSGLERFKKTYPDQYVKLGISEQNMIGVAAGMAKEGFQVFVTSFAPFLSMRASEQIRMNLGYMGLNVNLVALGSGLSMAYLGNSHFGLEDIAVMRTVPNLSVLSPADCYELREILTDVTENKRGPTYIRLTGVPGVKPVYDGTYEYKWGKLQQLSTGKQALALTTGAVATEVCGAIKSLSLKGIEITLITVPQIKPLPADLIGLLNRFKKIIIVEEHSVVGGLSSAIAEALLANTSNKDFLSIALPDNFGPTGTYPFLLEHHGLTKRKIEAQIEHFLL
ncbi:transketolase C-terminal domain-containing protein [Alphaproteobacteria bacterium]|nr:transketolase C-terminal domain-containing protein [Alphaproteobacteria bacterium]